MPPQAQPVGHTNEGTVSPQISLPVVIEWLRVLCDVLGGLSNLLQAGVSRGPRLSLDNLVMNMIGRHGPTCKCSLLKGGAGEKTLANLALEFVRKCEVSDFGGK